MRCKSGAEPRYDGTGQGLATIPEIIWEFGVGMYATVWGFRKL
jgi:hypothetical protein